MKIRPPSEYNGARSHWTVDKFCENVQVLYETNIAGMNIIKANNPASTLTLLLLTHT